MCQSIFSSTQYFTLPKFFTSKFSYLFVTPPIKLKLGQKIGGKVRKTKHGNVITMAQSKTLSNSQIIFITLLFAGAPLQTVQLC
jgi:hypothetical protein